MEYYHKDEDFGYIAACGKESVIRKSYETIKIKKIHFYISNILAYSH